MPREENREAQIMGFSLEKKHHEYWKIIELTYEVVSKVYIRATT